MTQVAVFGVSGRMGRCLVRAIRDSADFTLTGALASPRSAALGRDAGDVAQCPPMAVPVTADRSKALAQAEVAIDFTLPEALDETLSAVRKAGVPLVIGMTGLDDLRLAQIRAASGGLAILLAPNMSLAVNLLFGLAARAAAALPPDYDAEILEAHHRNKADAPSGTALRLGEIVSAAGGRKVGFASLRAGDIVGDHHLLFAGTGESLELVHRTTDRMTFAVGALTAARWLVGRPPGLYGMSDVLGL